MRPLALFSKLLLFVVLLVPILALHGAWKNSAYTKNLTTSEVGLAGNPLQNNTIYFRYFEYSDFFSAHQFFPSSPILERESFLYSVKNR